MKFVCFTEPRIMRYPQCNPLIAVVEVANKKMRIKFQRLKLMSKL